MTMRKFVLAAMISCLVSCEYNEVPHNRNFTIGAYKGQLSILYGVIDYPLFDATLAFTDDRFSLEIRDAYNPDHTLPPNMCNTGTYKVTGQEIEFTTDCTQPAEDWSWFMAINGKFQLKVVDRQVEISKTGDPTVSYKLILQ
jgi:hypothetical protein